MMVVEVQPRVLIIDDDEVVREAMSDLLRNSGCTVFDSGSPIGVTKTIVDNQINVIVLDVMMPEISGVKLARLLRSNPRMHQLSIILVSSADATRLGQIAIEINAESVMPKANIHRDLCNIVLAAYQRKQLTLTSRR
jgi:two-component system phosphate regulon response regulator PhoB